MLTDNENRIGEVAVEGVRGGCVDAQSPGVLVVSSYLANGAFVVVNQADDAEKVFIVDEADLGFGEVKGAGASCVCRYRWGRGLQRWY